jgi:hypothetical protein
VFSQKYPAKSGTQEIRFIYLHVFLSSTGEILPVYVWRYGYMVAEINLKEGKKRILM